MTTEGNGTDRYDFSVLRSRAELDAASAAVTSAYADELLVDLDGAAQEVNAIRREAEQLTGSESRAGARDDQRAVARGHLSREADDVFGRQDLGDARRARAAEADFDARRCRNESISDGGAEDRGDASVDALAGRRRELLERRRERLHVTPPNRGQWSVPERGVDVQPEILFDAGRRARSVWLDNAPFFGERLEGHAPLLGIDVYAAREVAADDVEVPLGVELPPEVLALLRATRVFAPPGAPPSVGAPVDAGHGQLPFPGSRAVISNKCQQPPGRWDSLHCRVCTRGRLRSIWRPGSLPGPLPETTPGRTPASSIAPQTAA